MFITRKVIASKSPYDLSDKKRAYLIELLSAAEELSRGDAFHHMKPTLLIMTI